MKVPAMVAVMVLSAASMWAQAAPAAKAPAPAASTAPATEAAKPAEPMHCMRAKGMNNGKSMKKSCHCMKNKNGKMADGMNGKMKGSCPRMKKEAGKSI